MRRAAGILREVAGWMLVVAVPGAAWMFGSLPPVAMEMVLAWIVVAAGLWGVSLLLERRRPAGHGLLVIGGLLVVIGWAMTLHPVARYDAVGRRFIGSGAAFSAGTVDALTSFLTMRSVTVLFVAFWMGVDLFRGAGFRRRFLWVLAIGGASVAGLGILQRAGLSGFLLEYMKPTEGQAFGPFNYHGNAGAFLLLGLGAAAGLFAGAVAGGKRWAMVAAGMAGAIVLVGICVCTSRTAVVLSVVMLPALAFGFWRMFSPALVRVREGRRRIFWGVSAGMVLAMGLAVLVMPAKWRLLAGQITGEHGRYIVWRMGLGMAQDAGWFGYGPGTFGLMLPVTPRFDPELYRQAIVTYQVPGEQVSMWVHAHNDLLQSVAEWGWIGGMLWAAAAGMVVVAGVRAVRGRGVSAMERAGVLGAFGGLLAVMGQSAVDFPFGVLAIQLPAVLCAALVCAGRKRDAGLMERARVERVEVTVRMRGGAGKWRAGAGRVKRGSARGV